MKKNEFKKNPYVKLSMEVISVNSEGYMMAGSPDVQPGGGGGGAVIVVPPTEDSDDTEISG